MGAQIDQNSMRKWSRRRDAFRHRFWPIFCRLLIPSWGGKLNKNRFQNDPKTESKMERILASIFDRFWRIWAAKLESKIEPRSVWPAWRGVARRHGVTWRGVSWRVVACRGVEGVKGVKGGSARPWRVGRKGFALLKGVDLPRAPDSLRPAGLERLIATFWPSWCLPFFHRFFDAFLGRSWLHFPSQLGFQNPPKSIKNRCSTRFPFCLGFLIDF